MDLGREVGPGMAFSKPLDIELALERRFRRTLDVKSALERRFRRPLDVKLVLEWRFWVPIDVKLALEPRFQEPLDVKFALERRSWGIRRIGGFRRFWVWGRFGQKESFGSFHDPRPRSEIFV